MLVIRRDRDVDVDDTMAVVVDNININVRDETLLESHPITKHIPHHCASPSRLSRHPVAGRLALYSVDHVSPSRTSAASVTTQKRLRAGVPRLFCRYHVMMYIQVHKVLRRALRKHMQYVVIVTPRDSVRGKAPPSMNTIYI